MRRSFYGSTPIISISYSLHQPLQNRTIPLTFRNANIYMHDTLQICTILFAFRRVRVCVCFLVSHPCETMGTHAKASLPCLPLPLHRPTPFPQPLQKDNMPSPRTTTLASLVKGRWIGGKAQTLTLLHLLAICSPFLYCKLFCRQDGGIATPTAPFPFL